MGGRAGAPQCTSATSMDMSGPVRSSGAAGAPVDTLACSADAAPLHVTHEQLALAECDDAVWTSNAPRQHSHARRRAQRAGDVDALYDVASEDGAVRSVVPKDGRPVLGDCARRAPYARMAGGSEAGGMSPDSVNMSATGGNMSATSVNMSATGVTMSPLSVNLSPGSVNISPSPH
eukprot:IDg19529t1